MKLKKNYRTEDYINLTMALCGEIETFIRIKLEKAFSDVELDDEIVNKLMHSLFNKEPNDTVKVSRKQKKTTDISKRCEATTKSGNRCSKTKSKDSVFCKIHENYVKEESEEDEGSCIDENKDECEIVADDPPIYKENCCSFTSNTGKKCVKNKSDSSDYCRTHADFIEQCVECGEENEEQEEIISGDESED